MKWTYKHHRLISNPLWEVMGVFRFLLDLSWTYAHYRNGSFPYQYPDNPRLRWVNASFWSLVREAWQGRHGDY